MPPSRPAGVPGHLPARLTISLWDFTWYTQTTPGEPFADLDVAFAEAVDRGYNTVRICAMPYLLFGDHGLDTRALHLTNMGPGFGQRTRWYDAAGGAVIDGRQHLRRLFEAARRHNCYIILSSWEYQQSAAFLSDRSWYDALTTVDPAKRFGVLAEAMGALVDHLKDHDLADRIAYTELHNEVDLSRLTEIAPSNEGPHWPQREANIAAVAQMRERHPDVLATTCYGVLPHLDMGSVADNGQVAHFHLYVYGVLRALEEWAGVHMSPPGFPSPELNTLLRRDAPRFDDTVTGPEQWKLDAAGVSASTFYTYEWVDPARWDLWLYEHYAAHKEAMRQALEDRLSVIATFARLRSVPAVIGEGWIGYTPLRAEFEDGPVGRDIAEHAISTAIDHEYWGVVAGSNSAPHHPGWSNVDWQRHVNCAFASGTPITWGDRR